MGSHSHWIHTRKRSVGRYNIKKVERRQCQWQQQQQRNRQLQFWNAQSNQGPRTTAGSKQQQEGQQSAQQGRQEHRVACKLNESTHKSTIWVRPDCQFSQVLPSDETLSMLGCLKGQPISFIPFLPKVGQIEL